MTAGITLAYAGKRSKSMTLRSLRGEKRTRNLSVRSRLGSPPHVRGKEQMLQQAGRVWGITPAYAGKSDRADIILSPNRDHPRVCGEKMKLPPW